MKRFKDILNSENVLLLVAFLFLIATITYGSSDQVKNQKALDKQNKEEVKDNQEVCKSESIDCLFVGCNGFY